MRILALETSTREASVALLQSTLDPTGSSESFQTELETNLLGSLKKKPAFDSNACGPDEGAASVNAESRIIVVQEFSPLATESSSQEPRKTSSKTLISTIKLALDEAQWTPQQIDLIAVTIGPGSFTGLRIGVVTAKALAYATAAQVVGVHTLEAIANQTREYVKDQQRRKAESDTSFVRRICVAMDAQRGQVFSGQFPLTRERAGELTAVEIVDRDSWLDAIQPDEIASGPVLKRSQTELAGGKFAFQVAPEDLWYPRAGTVGRIGFRQFILAGPDDMWKLQPLYLRPSYAEESPRD